MNPETHTLVCFALKEEAGAFRKLASGRKDVSILITGIGRQNAEKTVGAVLKSSFPKLVLTCGFAGALDPGLLAGNVVFSMADASLREKLLAAGAKSAIFFCASRIATTAAEKLELRRSTGSDAVEMESEAIHAVCRERGIPCATVRVISDTANEDLPLDFNQFGKPDMNLNYGKLMLAITKSPGKIPALLRLRKNTTFAAKQLADMLAKVIGPH